MHRRNRKQDFLLVLNADGLYSEDLSDYHTVEDKRLDLYFYKEDFPDVDFFDASYVDELIKSIDEQVQESRLEWGFEFEHNDVKAQVIYFKERGGINRQIMLYSPGREL